MMSLQRRLLLMTFFESFATILLERGVYFYSEDRLDFDKSLNLWLALGFGLCYIVGALTSHRIADRLGERRLLLIAITAQGLLHLALVFAVSTPMLFVAMGLAAILNGWKWPVVESYITAGRTSALQLRSIGYFNVAWASAVPLSLFIVGPMVGSAYPEALFLLAALLNIGGFALAWHTPKQPAHFEPDHPDLPSPTRRARYRVLLIASRWSMLASCSLLFLLAPMLPQIFTNLGVGVVIAPALSALIDIVRLGTFVLLQRWHGWYGRPWPMALSLLMLPISCALALFSNHVALVLIGEIMFGFCSGLTYYAALYYVIATKNASVDAGGTHEGLIGAGFAFGPAAGLIGIALSDVMGSYVLGMTVGIAPLILLTMLGGLLQLRKLPPARK